MNRLFALVVVASVCQSSIAFAAGPIAASAATASKQATATATETAGPSPLGFASFATAARVGAAPAQGVLAQQGGTISQSGLTKRTKAMIIVGAAVAFVGTAYGIDHRVKDVTPSSLGTRHDNDVFKK